MVQIKDEKHDPVNWGIIIGNNIAMMISGLSLGWMIGMTTSPVIKDVILSILIVLVTIMGLIAGFGLSAKLDPVKGLLVKTKTGDKESQSSAKKSPNKNDLKTRNAGKYVGTVNLLPIGLLIFFMGIGAAMGIVVRSNKVLGPNPSILTAFWGLQKNKPLLSERQIQKVLMTTLTDSASAGLPFLYEGSLSFCELTGLSLRNSLRSASTSIAYETMIREASDSTLIQLRDEYCKKK